MTVPQGISLFISHGFEELVNPYRSIDSKALTVEGGKRGRAGGRRDDGPEACDTHGGDKSMPVTEHTAEDGKSVANADQRGGSIIVSEQPASLSR